MRYRYLPTDRISDLDIETWRWIIERYAGMVDDVCELRGIKKRTAYEHIQKWVDRGYFYRKGGYLLPTRRTYWECGVPYTFHDLGLEFLRHAADVTKVEHWLRQREDMVVMSWTGERYLRHVRGVHDSLEFGRFDPGIPDAEAEIHSNISGRIEKVAVEVERTYKGPERIYKTLGNRASAYDYIWYFAKVPSVYNPVKTCIANMPPEDIRKFTLWKLDTVTCESKLTPARTQI